VNEFGYVSNGFPARSSPLFFFFFWFFFSLPFFFFCRLSKRRRRLIVLTKRMGLLMRLVTLLADFSSPRKNSLCCDLANFRMPYLLRKLVSRTPPCPRRLRSFGPLSSRHSPLKGGKIELGKLFFLEWMLPPHGSACSGSFASG